MGKRKRYSAEFKAKVAIEALRGELTVSQLTTKYGVHHTMIGAWKRQATESLVSVFSDKGPRRLPGAAAKLGGGAHLRLEDTLVRDDEKLIDVSDVDDPTRHGCASVSAGLSFRHVAILKRGLKRTA